MRKKKKIGRSRTCFYWKLKEKVAKDWRVSWKARINRLDSIILIISTKKWDLFYSADLKPLTLGIILLT